MRIHARSNSWILICLAIKFLGCAALAAPSSLQLGELLGYPGSEIIVEDITDQERKLWGTPTARERKQGVIMPDTQTLITAYKISGKTSSTFHTILIWMGTKGVFLNSDTQKTLNLIATDEAKPISKGGRGPFGSQSFEGLGEGGVYLGKIKVSSAIKEMSEPQEKAAMISVLYLPSRKLDVRIALMANLEGGTDLDLLSGGEKYFEAFRPPNDDEKELRYDVAKLFRGLNQLVAAEPSIAKPSQPLPPQQDKQAIPPENQPNDAIHKNQPDSVSKLIKPQPQETSWLWLVGLIALLSVMGFAVKRYFSKLTS
jgi:hypothetical protein